LSVNQHNLLKILPKNSGVQTLVWNLPKLKFGLRKISPTDIFTKTKKRGQARIILPAPNIITAMIEVIFKLKVGHFEEVAR